MLRRACFLLLLGGCASGPDPVVDAALPDAASPGDGAGDVPAIDATAGLFLTVNELPDYLSGARPYRQSDGVPHEFRVRVNRSSFTLDVRGAGDWAAVAVTCDQPITLPGGAIVAPGAPLPASAFTATAEGRRILFTEPALPDGATVRCQAAAGGATSALTFLAATLPPVLDPFPQMDPWLVILSRDLFRLEVTVAPDGTRRLTSVYVPGGNGEPDLDEALYELGLLSRKAPEFSRQIKERLLGEVGIKARRIFGLGNDGLPGPDGVRLRLWFEGDPGAPAAADAAAGGVSLIALGGDGTPEDQADNISGRADLDWNNRVRNDNAGYGRGAYVTSIVRQALANPVSLVLLAAILPGRGLPLGEDPEDRRLLVLDFDMPTTPAGQMRQQVYMLVMRLLSTALASTLCHEMGHSLGLVPSGPPPLGLFAEMPGLDFTVKDSTGPHIDTPGLNVEQTGASTSWMDALVEEPRFNQLSLAYLRRRLVVGAP